MCLGLGVCLNFVFFIELMKLTTVSYFLCMQIVSEQSAEDDLVLRGCIDLESAPKVCEDFYMRD